MAELVLRGISASAGSAAGPARLLAGPDASDREIAPAERPAAAELALEALGSAADELGRLASSLRAQGRADEAEIVDTGALIAADPAFSGAVRDAVLTHGRPPAAALMEAAELHAQAIASVGDELLAARADDVRSVGRRAARLAAGDTAEALNGGPAPGAVLVAPDLGPGDVAELGADVKAIALAGGGVTAHAAIVARSLGIPMVVGLGSQVLDARAGAELVVEGAEGVVVLEPSAERSAAARAAALAGEISRRRASASRELPAETRDGHRVAVLANVAGPAEAALGREAGAEGAGLVRTELAFLEAAAWPSEEDHRRMLEPLLAELRGLPVTIRVLDFGGDKSPPFLRGAEERGIALLLRHGPEALLAQLRAIARLAAGADLRIMLPMVGGVEDVLATRTLLEQALRRAPIMPPLGAMVETPAAAAAAGALAGVSDFLSVGTNDLTHETLGSDRYAPGASRTHHPQVLRLLARTLDAARDAGIPAEICGEAASDPLTLPIVLGLGARELSVGAARVGMVREWVRALDRSHCAELAKAALAAAGPDEVAGLAADSAALLRSVGQRADAAGQSVDGSGGVVAIGPQP
jgi:phosphoenolpyruvate-protein kinase (PTS system EI component)